MNVKELSTKTKSYIIDLIDNIAQSNFLISVARPAINLAIDNNFYKLDNLFELISDKEGNLDIEKLIDDTISSVLNGKKGILPVGKLGNIEVGNNEIKLTIPSLNYYISFDSNDFIKFKNYILGNGTKTLY